MDFYIYEHWRPDTNVCFYVGKGKGNRAWIMAKRNPYHKAIQSKLISLGMSIDVRIVIKNLSEETAFLIEKDRIAFYGIENLSNLTLGGEGSSGFIPNDQWKEKQSLAHKGKKRSKEICQKISKKLKGNKNTLGRILSEETKKKIGQANKICKRLPISEETRKKLSFSSKNRIRRPWSIEEKEILSKSHKNKKASDETKKKMSETQKQIWAARKAG